MKYNLISDEKTFHTYSIVRHIRNIYKSEELDQNSTCAKNAQVRTEGHRCILHEIPSSSNTSSRDVNNYRKLETYLNAMSFHTISPYSRKTRLFMKRIRRFES